MTKLITYQYLRQETDISQNVDNERLDNPIKRAQEDLKFLLGTAFYEQIESQFTANTLSTDNDSLFDPYIKKFLAFQAYEYYISRSDFYESRTGLRRFNEENSELLSDSRFGDFIRTCKEWTQKQKGYMLTFIKQEQRIDSSKYSLYRDCGDKIGTGFHITAVTAKRKESNDINRRIILNGD
jgi:hypothetical protein